jgi:hypothetical protein
MAIVLRLVSLFVAIQTVQTIWAFIWLLQAGSLAAFASRGLGKLTLAGWLLLCAIGPIAVAQLWRLRESGRRAAIVFTAVGLVYYIVGGAMFRAPGAPLAGLAIGVLSAAVPLAILLTPSAKRACAASTERETPQSLSP